MEFTLITGITKLSQLRIYSELNNQNTEGLFYRTDIGSKANK